MFALRVFITLQMLLTMCINIGALITLQQVLEFTSTAFITLWKLLMFALRVFRTLQKLVMFALRAYTLQKLLSLYINIGPLITLQQVLTFTWQLSKHYDSY